MLVRLEKVESVSYRRGLGSTDEQFDCLERLVWWERRCNTVLDMATDPRIWSLARVVGASVGHVLIVVVDWCQVFGFIRVAIVFYLGNNWFGG